MKVSEQLLVAGASHNDPAVRALVAECRELEAETLKGRAFHRRAAHLTKVEAVLRNVIHGGVSLPGAMVDAGLAKPSTTPLGGNPGDKAAVPSAKR